MESKFQNEWTWLDCPVPACRDDEYEEVAWGLHWKENKFRKITINRPRAEGRMVRMEVKFCGLCHTDKHVALNDFGGAMYPMVPGHELAGIVTEVGPEVTKVAVGDKVAVGYTSDSCMECDQCKAGEENYCKKGGHTTTFNCPKDHGHMGGNPDTQTFGGYSGSHCLHERYVVRLPPDMPLHRTAPLVCAGITMFDPLLRAGALDAGRKMTIGIAGLGGLGTMGVKLAVAMGHRVVVISGSPRKREMALEKGADDFVVLSEGKAVAEHADSMDLILNTIAAHVDLDRMLSMLGAGGTLVQLGLTVVPAEISVWSLMQQRKSVTASQVGGMKALQECIEFCYKHSVYPDVEVVDATRIEEVYMIFEEGNSAGTRYVLDIEKSLAL